MELSSLPRRRPVPSLFTALALVALAVTAAYFAGLVPGVPKTLPTFVRLLQVTVVLLVTAMWAGPCRFSARSVVCRPTRAQSSVGTVFGVGAAPTPVPGFSTIPCFHVPRESHASAARQLLKARNGCWHGARFEEEPPAVACAGLRPRRDAGHLRTRGHEGASSLGGVRAAPASASEPQAPRERAGGAGRAGSERLGAFTV